MSDSVAVIFHDMPTTVHGFTIADEDDHCTIVLNSRDSTDRQLQAYQHEMGHIEDGDCSDLRPADLIELLAHEKKPPQLAP